jgi:hypothetical protein
LKSSISLRTQAIASKHIVEAVRLLLMLRTVPLMHRRHDGSKHAKQGCLLWLILVVTMKAPTQ